jgi:hypothetical protein
MELKRDSVIKTCHRQKSTGREARCMGGGGVDIGDSLKSNFKVSVVSPRIPCALYLLPGQQFGKGRATQNIFTFFYLVYSQYQLSLVHRVETSLCTSGLLGVFPLATGVRQGVAMDSRKFHLGSPCSTLLWPAGVAHPQGRQPAPVLYPFGHPTP